MVVFSVETDAYIPQKGLQVIHCSVDHHGDHNPTGHTFPRVVVPDIHMNHHEPCQNQHVSTQGPS